MRLSYARRDHRRSLVLPHPCPATAEEIGSGLELKLCKGDKVVELSDDLPVKVVRCFPEKRLDIVYENLAFPL